MPFNFFSPQEDEDNLNITQQPLPVALSNPPEEEPQVQAPAPAPQQAQPFQITNPAVKDYLSKLYGDKFSDDARQKIVDQNAEDEGGLNFGAALSALGAGFSGRDANAAGDSVLDRQKKERADRLAAFDTGRKGIIDNFTTNTKLRDDAQGQEKLAREQDPTSEESKLAQTLASKMVPSKDFSKMNAAQINGLLPGITKIYEIEQKKIERADARADKLAAKNSGATEGQKATDKDYAKDYNDFTGGGETKAKNALAKLRSLRSDMAKDNGVIQAGGGPISGSLPDWARTQKSIAQRDNIVSAANSALKATFGAQLSDGERKALANEFYNDRLSNEENLKIIDRKIAELDSGLATQKEKARYFAKKGSLTGFTGGSGGSGGDSKYVKMIDPDGNVRSVSKSEVNAALAAGGKLAEGEEVASRSGNW